MRMVSWFMGMACLLLGLTGFARAVDLSAYPRVPLHDLYQQSRNGLQGKAPDSVLAPGAPLLVVGVAVPAPPELEHDAWVLIGGIRACCNMYMVGLPLRGKHAFTEGQWIAVGGHVDRSGPAWTASSLRWNGQPVFLGGDDLGVVAEHVVPAEKIVHANNVVDLLKGESVQTFRRALEQSGLVQEIKTAEDVTLLVPHNLAFDRLPEATQNDLSDPQKPFKLRHLLLGHMLEGRWTVRELMEQTSITMMNGDQQPVTVDNGKLLLGGSRILMKNLPGHNGVAHIVMPLLPVSEFETQPGSGRLRGFNPDPLDL